MTDPLPKGGGKAYTLAAAKRHEERRAKEDHLLELSERAAATRRPGQTTADRLAELREEER